MSQKRSQHQYVLKRTRRSGAANRTVIDELLSPSNELLSLNLLLGDTGIADRFLQERAGFLVGTASLQVDMQLAGVAHRQGGEEACEFSFIHDSLPIRMFGQEAGTVRLNSPRSNQGSWEPVLGRGLPERESSDESA